MRIKLLSPATNVVRFPVERRARATLELMRELAPDAADVASLATSGDFLTSHPSLREQAGSAAAKRISGDRCGGYEMPLDVLDGLLTPVVAEAVSLCWSVQDATAAMLEAQHELSQARRTGIGWLDGLRARAAALTSRRADLLLAAHARVEAAEGIAHAVALARRGEPWAPHAIDSVPEPTGEPGYKTVVRARLAPNGPRRSPAKSSRASRPGTDKPADCQGRPDIRCPVARQPAKSLGKAAAQLMLT